METREILEINKEDYQHLYSTEQIFLRYPADWIIRFHAFYLKRHIPTGKVLDYGCGSGNNSIFFIEKGYDVHGLEVPAAALDQIKTNLESRGLNAVHTKKFQLISPDWKRLPFDDNFFDFILSNQVLYYLGSEERIQEACREFDRCLRPGGVVFFTMMGPRNDYIVYHAKQIHKGRLYEVAIENPAHRLAGLKELIYLVRDQQELKRLFSQFECVSTGYFDQSMLDMVSNFHWIFVGRKCENSSSK